MSVPKTPAISDKDPNDFQRRVRERLAELNLDPFAAAAKAEFADRRFIYDITILRKESVRGANLAKLAKALDWTMAELLGEAPVAPVELDETAIEMPPVGEEVPAPRLEGNRDVPEYGVAIGGSDDDDADFSLNGQVVDYLVRLPGIARRKDVFVLRAVNDSMYPRFEPGHPLFIDPHRRAQVGDDVVVELKPGPEGQPGKAYIKRLVRRSASRIIVEQFNPAKEIEFDPAAVKAIYRVIPLAELVGVG